MIHGARGATVRNRKTRARSRVEGKQVGVEMESARSLGFKGFPRLPDPNGSSEASCDRAGLLDTRILLIPRGRCISSCRVTRKMSFTFATPSDRLSVWHSEEFHERIS